MIKLEKALQGLPFTGKLSEKESVTGITSDSREVKSGDLFIAIPPLSGAPVTEHLSEAIQKGAASIITQKDTPLPGKKPKALHVFEVENPRKIRALIAANLYPHQPHKIVAVTGTNGKTSVTHFLTQIWNFLGKKASCVGTLGLLGDVDLKNKPKSSLTSPDPFVLHKLLHQLADKGVDCAALEASSHGLDQYRLDGVRLASAAFTNLTHDHLDYHGSFQKYFDAKKRLFTELLMPGNTAVLNADDPRFQTLTALCRERGHQILSYGRAGREIALESIDIEENGQKMAFRVLGRRYEIHLPLVGVFQGYNVLCALGLALGAGEKEDDVVSCLSKLTNVPGRLEYMGKSRQGGAVYVDYAHTPQALETVLTSLRPHVKGLLSLVFGCGGDRDQEKRPMMGKAAAQYADRIFVTDDNPRSEDPGLIRKQILTACSEGYEVPDREDAIKTAIKKLGPHEALIIAGKGHENEQIIKGKHLPFDDREIAKKFLKK